MELHELDHDDPAVLGVHANENDRAKYAMLVGLFAGICCPYPIEDYDHEFHPTRLGEGVLAQRLEPGSLPPIARLSQELLHNGFSSRWPNCMDMIDSDLRDWQKTRRRQYDDALRGRLADGLTEQKARDEFVYARFLWLNSGKVLARCVADGLVCDARDHSLCQDPEDCNVDCDVDSDYAVGDYDVGDDNVVDD